MHTSADTAFQHQALGKQAAEADTSSVFVPWLVNALTARLKVEPAGPQGIANSLWALAKLGHYDSLFIGACIQQALTPGFMEAFLSQHLSNSLWALSVLRHYDASFIEAWVKHALRPGCLATFTPQNFSNSLYALAMLGHCNLDFLRTCLHQLNDSFIDRFNGQNVGNILWALAAWYARAPKAERAALGPAVEKAAAALLGRFERLLVAIPGSISPEEYRQAFQALDVLPCGVALRKRHPALAQRFRAEYVALAKLNHANTRHGSNITDSQQQLLDLALDLGYKAVPEALTADKTICVDVELVLSDGRRVALEFDGPWHYSVNVPHVLNGATYLRNAMLERRGYIVVGIPFYIFHGKGRQAQREYVTRRLIEGK